MFGAGAAVAAALAAERQLVVVQSASKLGLLQLRGDVLVWHFVFSGLDEKRFLRTC